MEILLSEEHGGTELRQSIGRLINAIVAVMGPELSPGSSFFSRCKSVVSEISSGDEPSVLLEGVRFTQQLALFAPQAVSVHLHVQTLRPTLSSRQPTLRQAAVSTLRHLAEKDPVGMIDERIEEDLFSMLDMETDSMIGNIVLATIDRLLDAACPSCPSRWLQICRNVVLATSTKKAVDNGYSESESGNVTVSFGEDDEGMIASSKKTEGSGSVPSHLTRAEKADQLPRYRTRIFAAQCLTRLPIAVGMEPAHFDLARARKVQLISSGDWLVLHLAELVALAYQISTTTLEKMQPLGVMLLSTIVDKFAKTADPELPGHFLMEQYQAQLVSAVRTALDTSAGPLLLDAGLQLATKILTSSITSGDRVVLQRMFTLISRPLGDFEDLYYPSFAEWVGCKVKIRLLAAHAAVKTYAYYCLKDALDNTEYQALLPLLSKNSYFLGRCWIGLLRDHMFLHTHVLSKRQYKPFLDGIQSAAVSLVVQPYLDEVWPVILQAVTLDAAPEKFDHEMSSSPNIKDKGSDITYTSGWIMVKLEIRDFCLLWGLAVLILFEGRNQDKNETFLHFSSSCAYSVNGKLAGEVPTNVDSKFNAVALYALQCLSNKGFYVQEMLSSKLCLELLQILMYPGYINSPWTITLVLSILEQVLKFCPDEYLENESFVFTATELCMHCMHKIFGSDANLHVNFSNHGDLIAASLRITENLVHRLSPKKQRQLVPKLFYASYKYICTASMGASISAVTAFLGNIAAEVNRKITDKSYCDNNSMEHIGTLLGSLVQSIAQLSEQFIDKVQSKEEATNKASEDFLMKLPLLLGLMMTLARSVWDTEYPTDEDNIKESIWTNVQKCCINCLHGTLVDSNVQIQMAGVHTLRTVIQTALAESSKNRNHTLALLFMAELAADVFSLIQNSTQKSMTSDSAAVVGESLKLFVLLHSLMQANEYQQDVLNFLLQAIVISASVDTGDGSQAGIGLRSMAMKLVTHLAHVPSSAAQFRAVLLEMPVHFRQKLQDIIRASVAQESSSSSTTVLSVPLPAPKPVIQSLAAKVELSSQEDSFLSTTDTVNANDIREDAEDDDWDNFQSFPVSSSVFSENANEHKTDTTKDVSEQETDFPGEDWDDFQSFSGSQLNTDSIVLESTLEARQLNYKPTEDPSVASKEFNRSKQETNTQAEDGQANALINSVKPDHGNDDVGAKDRNDFQSFQVPERTSDPDDNSKQIHFESTEPELREFPTKPTEDASEDFKDLENISEKTTKIEDPEESVLKHSGGCDTMAKEWHESIDEQSASSSKMNYHTESTKAENAEGSAKA
eukprot:Gb_38775 [translate_table: standard]